MSERGCLGTLVGLGVAIVLMVIVNGVLLAGYETRDARKEDRLNTLEEHLQSAELEINAAEETLTRMDSTMEGDKHLHHRCTAEIREFERRGDKQGGLREPEYSRYTETLDRCNALVDRFNRDVEQYNTLLAAYESDIVTYNLVVNEYNSIASTMDRTFIVIGPRRGRGFSSRK